ncbi:hypothetical protein CHS0354_013877, partial [Potamilus streckersoni]
MSDDSEAHSTLFKMNWKSMNERVLFGRTDTTAPLEKDNTVDVKSVRKGHKFQPLSFTFYSQVCHIRVRSVEAGVMQSPQIGVPPLDVSIMSEVGQNPKSRIVLSRATINKVFSLPGDA